MQLKPSLMPLSLSLSLYMSSHMLLKNSWYKYRQNRQCMYKLSIEAGLCNHCCCGKAISITYSECVSVALVTQHAMHMCRIMLSLVTCLALP